LVGRYNLVMKVAAFCLLFAWNINAQELTADSVVSRLESTLQEIQTDEVHQPFSVVIVLPADAKLQAALRSDIHKIARMLAPLGRSGHGEVEVLAYGDQLGVSAVQPFTTDSAKAAKAIADLKISAAPQGATSNLLDAIAKATSDLEVRSATRRGIVLVLGKNENGAEKKLADLIEDAAGRLPNVVFLFPLIP
jgi:hypothetical protein